MTSPATDASVPSSIPQRSFVAGLSVQLRCLEGLIVRDMMMRYGRGNLGFLWVLIEPMLLCVGVLLIWSLIKGTAERGIDLITFVISGYMPLTLWRHVTNSGTFSLRRGASLLYHRHISTIDTQIARIVLEFAGATTAFVVVVATTWTIGVLDPIDDYLLVVCGWLIMAALAAGASLIICGLTEYSEIWERFMTPYQYLMVPLSGTFFMVAWLPPTAQEVALLNPLVHTFEMVRSGFLGDRVVTHYNVWYPLLWALATTVFGLWLMEKARAHLHLG